MNKQQIAEKLIENHQRFADFVSSLNEQDFLFAPEDKWTAGQQLEHIIRGISPVKMALTLPKIVASLLFGKAQRNSLSYDEIVAQYQSRLATGSKASKRFIPPEISFEKRETLKTQLLNVVHGLTAKVEKFSEKQLDEYVLPHPILGKLTIREMLYFTIYHVEHHHRAVLRNLGKRGDF
jgi:hypothetical protein